MVVLPVISADVILQQVDESSGLIIDKNLDIELRDAEVIINFNNENYGYLEATFEIYSNEEELVNSKVYLKAKGQNGYRERCEDINVTNVATQFEITNTETIYHPDGATIHIYDHNEPTEIYTTAEGTFASSAEFLLPPKQIMKIKVYQDITEPYEYYLDSLSTFTKADHEKITIYGNVDIEFNENYPVKKISDSEWVWEYSNLDVNDENLKDVLVIKRGVLIQYQLQAQIISFIILVEQ